AAGAAHALALLGAPRWPLIREQPASVLTQEHSEVTLAVVAEASSNMRYAWWFNGSPIPGATNAALTLSDISTANVGLYSVFISTGGFTIQSAAASVALPELVIVQHGRDEVVLGGDTARFAPLVLGAEPIHYQWSFNVTAIPDAENS